VSDADVRLISGTDTFQLQFSPEYGYFYPDPARRIQSQQEYRLEVRFPDGKFATGTTVTPDSIAWIQPPKPMLQYPKDTMTRLTCLHRTPSASSGLPRTPFPKHF